MFDIFKARLLRYASDKKITHANEKAIVFCFGN